MNLNIKFKLGLLIFLFIAFANSSFAADTTEYKSKMIEIIDSKYDEIYTSASRIVTVISREEINNAAVNNVQDLLEYSASVDVRQRGALGAQSDVSLRGGTFDQTLILINGVPVSDPQTGHHNMNLPIDVKDVERVEILRGSGARSLGSNAFAGAINFIVSAKSGENKVKVGLAGGENKYYKGSVSASRDFGPFDAYASALKQKCDGYTNNTDFATSNVYLSANYRPSFGIFNLQMGHNERAFGANSFYTAIYPNQFEETKTTFMSLKGTMGDRLNISPMFYYRINQDKFELFRNNPATWYTGHNYHRTDVYGGELKFKYIEEWGISTVGFELRSENIKSNVLGNPMDPEDVPGEPNAKFTKKDSREIANIFADQSIVFGKFSFSAGVMVNHNSSYDWHTYYGADASYQVTDELNVFASLNSSNRAPTFTDLYYKGRTNRGNPNLVPEEATTYEAGIKYSTQFIKINLAYFKRDGKNMIDWIKPNIKDSTVWTTKNLTEVNTNGIELSAMLYTKSLFHSVFRVNYINIAFNHTNSTKQSDEYISYYVLDYLKNKLSVSVNTNIIEGLNWDIKLSYQEREGSYVAVTGVTKSFEPFVICDSKLSYKYQFAQISVEASNLLNKTYLDIGNVPEPGRWIKAGLDFEF